MLFASLWKIIINQLKQKLKNLWRNWKVMREILGLINLEKIQKILIIQEMKIKLFRINKSKKREETQRITKKV